MQPKTPPLFALEELQALVGGKIELIGRLAVNEDGRALDLPFNAVASRLVGVVIRGDAVLLTPEELAAAAS